MQYGEKAALMNEPKQITIRGFVWMTTTDTKHPGCTILWVGTCKHGEARGTGNFRTKSITIGAEMIAAIAPELLAKDAELAIVANYTERDGMLPIFEAAEIVAFDGRETADMKEWY